jgi:hypothetical protein
MARHRIESGNTMTDQEILELFSPLMVDLEDLAFVMERRPLLAHYTSLDVLEKIMRNGELWLSNPLAMNDLEEVRFGFLQGMKLVEQSEAVTRACKTSERAVNLRAAFAYYCKEFDEQHAFDTYVFCLTEHEPANKDGLLSMWRGYGGNGNGAALIFNSNFAIRNQNSPILISRVHYDTADGRILWINDRIDQWCWLLEKSGIPDDKLFLAAKSLFNFIKLFALKSKHDGFKEEREWRIIYLPERDTRQEAFKLDYIIGKHGVEPKLRFEIKPIDSTENWSFGDILDQIILGPSQSSWLARRGVERMLEIVGRTEFKKKLSVSGIPLRQT